MSFTVYRSSAGSGKTFTLVKEYLKIALLDTQLPPQQYKKILAITFTNKAAAEMKERVLKALKEIAFPGGQTVLFEIIQNETGLKKETLQVRAKEILDSVLHNYSDFAIGTIDSFVHRIVRTFAFDLKLPVSFDIETDETSLLKQAIELLLSKIGTEEKLTRLLIEFTESKTDDEKNWHIENDLIEFSKNLLKGENQAYLDKLKQMGIDDFIEVKKQLEKEINSYESIIQEIASGAFSLIQESNILPSSFSYGERGIYNYFKNLASGRFDFEPNSYVTTTINENKWISGKASKEDAVSIENIKNTLSEKYIFLTKASEQGRKKYILLTLIYRNIYPLAVLNEIEKVLEEYKKQNNILHISEFNNIISKIVLNQPVPFIYERLGEKYNYYLIDEFQDTSVLQWQNLLPLIDNSLASGFFNMIVGDGKQAIYRWRGGEVEQFSRLPEVISQKNNPLIQEREAALKRNFVQKNLSNNFRSKHEIISFNNLFFKTVSHKLHENIRNIYSTLEQNSDPGNTGGYIRISCIEGDKQIVEEKNKQLVLETIAHIKKQGFELKDIAIICRANKNCNLIAGFLADNKIPVVSSESLLLKSSRNINFILAALEYIKDETNQIPQIAILGYLLNENKLSRKSIESYITSLNRKETTLQHILNKEGFVFDRNILNRLMLYEMCEALTRVFGLNSGANLDIQFFLEEVFKYVNKKNNNLQDFIDWWTAETTQPSLVVPEGVNAIKVISIHKSKGLEYPVVIIPFAHWSIEKGNKNIWVDLPGDTGINLPATILPMQNKLSETVFADKLIEEENKSLLDNINLLYVALTRAVDQMYIFTGKPGEKTKEKFSSITDTFGYYFQTVNADIQTGIYEMGQFSPQTSREKRHKNKMYELKTLSSNNWEKKVSIRKSAWGKGLEENNSARLRGTFYHEALAKIKSKEDIEKTLISLHQENLIEISEMREMAAVIKKLMEKEEFKKIFDQNYIIRNESEIILPDGNTYRPDRVMIAKEHTIIVDFKTGQKKDIYKNQLNNYERALTQMGYKNIDKYILYIDSETLEKI